MVKEVFQIHGVDMHGKAVLRKQLRHSEMARFFANLGYQGRPKEELRQLELF